MLVNLNIDIRQTTSASAPKLTAFRNFFEADPDKYLGGNDV